MFALPAEVKLETVSEKGKNPTIILTSIDKQLIGQVAAKIRAFRKPEPYKVKGYDLQEKRSEGKWVKQLVNSLLIVDLISFNFQYGALGLELSSSH